MKKLLGTLTLFALLATPTLASEPVGFVYQNTTHHLLGSGSVCPSKVGKATCTQYFGIVAIGDCSIKKAMSNGKITALSHADQYTKNILGFKKITTQAYGQ